MNMTYGRQTLIAIAATLIIALPAAAHHDPENGVCEFDTGQSLPIQCGQLSKLIPVPIDAIHSGLAWTEASKPKICMAMRPSEYAGFHLTYQDEHDGHDHLFEPFRHFVYGGGGFSTGTHGLDESNTKGNTDRDNFVCWDLTHPDAFKETDSYRLIDERDPPQALLTKADFALTNDAFSDAGDYKGLHYNVFCSGNVALADGKWLFIGGHDKGGNNAIRKLNVFDPVTETWAPRTVPPVKQAYLEIFDELNPDTPPDAYPDFPNANDERNTDPADPSDMKYQRWYPSGALLPDKTVLLVAGTDQDTSLDTDRVECTEDNRHTHFRCSLITQVVPELYDPKTDRTIALENARKHHNTYPRVYVVQTGKKASDWKAAIIGEAHPGSLAKDADGKPRLGLAPTSVVTQYDPYTYTGKTYLFDVQAAKADSHRHMPAEHHYTYVDEAVNAHNFGAGAQLWETDSKGHAVSQKVVLFGGNCGGTRGAPPEIPQPPEACTGDLIESIDFQDAQPKWKQLGARLYLAISQNNAVVLPDGKVLISGGATGRGPWTNSFHLQIFDPKTETIEVLIDRKIAGHDHSTVALLPDGSVALLGGNATDLHGDHEHLELGIPVAQIYRPAYLFKGEPRPIIKDAPEKITYRQRFNVRVSEDTGTIKSVALIAFGPITHNWDWGKRYVKLWFKQNGKKLLVQAPANPGLAVPSYYMLFTVNDMGVPSVAKLIQLNG
jgi:hypothetical protein